MENQIDISLSQRLRGIEDYLIERVVGQRDVILSVAPLFCSGELGLRSPKQPKESFLFLGPTGVGKTELVKVIAHYLFGDGGLAVLDMSELQGPDAVTQLLGTRRDRGRFADRLLAMNGKGIVLLDEIEKADRRILDLLLQILDEGRLTLANGDKLDLRGFYIVLTSNIASEAIQKAQRTMSVTLRRFVETAAKSFLRPELFGRIGEVHVFQPLDFASRVKIGRMIAEEEIERLRALGEDVDGEFSESLLRMCAKNGEFGARPLRNKIQTFIQQQIVLQKLGSKPAMDRQEGFLKVS